MKKYIICIVYIVGGLVLLGLLGFLIYRSNFCLQTDCYQVTSEKITAPVRILLLSDLHNAEFGEENTDLLTAVAVEKPDLILFAGDLVTGSEPKTAVAEKLLKDLTALAPVYVSLGNHEQRHQKKYGSNLTEAFEAAGAKVLDFEFEDVQINGQKLRIGGISGYCVPEQHLATGEAKIEECEFLHRLEDTDFCRILMCHMPFSWQVLGALEAWEMDLVFSGHAHGGQWVLPLLGPVYAPDMGFFPGRSEGLFPSADGSSHLVLSQGLGSSIPFPRLNNRPQILVLELLPK